MTDVTIGSQIQLLGREVDKIYKQLDDAKLWTRDVREALGLEETESALARIKLLVKNAAYREHSVEELAHKLNEIPHYQYEDPESSDGDFQALREHAQEMLWAISELNK